jgi:hypothetical protein
MVLLGSGAISLGGTTTGRSVNIELGRSGTATISMNESSVRSLAGRSTGAISFSDFYNKSAFATLTYNFSSNAEGWVGSNTTLSVSGGALTVNSTGNDPFIRNPTGVNIPGGSAPIIRISIRRTAGTAWDGSIYYTTSGHGESDSFRNVMPQPAWDGAYKLIEMNMSNLFAGGTDWTTSTITRLRFDFGVTAADDFQIDFIQIDGGIVYGTGLYKYTAAGYHNNNANFVDGGVAVGAVTTVSEPSIAELQSIMWVGYFYARVAGDYTFSMATDDESYLWVGATAAVGYTNSNQLIFSNFNTGVVTSGAVTLTANSYTPIRMMMGNNVGPGSASLSFTVPGIGVVSDGTGYYLHNTGSLGL